jgi:hypothetical protein
VELLPATVAAMPNHNGFTEYHVVVAAFSGARGQPVRCAEGLGAAVVNWFALGWYQRGSAASMYSRQMSADHGLPACDCVNKAKGRGPCACDSALWMPVVISWRLNL